MQFSLTDIRRVDDTITRGIAEKDAHCDRNVARENALCAEEALGHPSLSGHGMALATWGLIMALGAAGRADEIGAGRIDAMMVMLRERQAKNR